VREVGESTTAAPPDPVPDSAIVCGLEGSPSAMLRVADLVPAAAGVNVTLAVQLAPAARLDPQVFVCEKSDGFVPEKVKLVIAIATELPFVIVIV